MKFIAFQLRAGNRPSLSQSICFQRSPRLGDDQVHKPVKFMSSLAPAKGRESQRVSCEKIALAYMT